MTKIKNKRGKKALPLSVVPDNDIIKQLSVEDKGKALGLLLGQALQLQSEMIQLFREEKQVNSQFFVSLLTLLAVLIREILARWSRCILTPLKALFYVQSWTINSNSSRYSWS